MSIYLKGVWQGLEKLLDTSLWMLRVILDFRFGDEGDLNRHAACIYLPRASRARDSLSRSIRDNWREKNRVQRDILKAFQAQQIEEEYLY